MKTLTFFAISLAGIAILAAPAAAQLGRRGGSDRFAQADSNGDGVVTREEFKTSRSARFKQMDRNGDGAVSRDDFGRILKFRPEAGQRLDDMLAEADANHDGSLTRAELDHAPMPLFDRADTNGDSRVDAQERAAAKELTDNLRAKAKR
ncbi:EF-hand domain-containing protein [Sphingobium sp. H33]|uniref:EF-hand domain-containing protein n=2 Tax=Sphingobium nicotianae TaxID=2782607 RepID=A0A9X1AIN6_9SPHN|nr:EF-hand domain-containing protein [Sphingobium nicotianae]